MADADQVNILKSGVESWNKWRRGRSWFDVDLTEADLGGADLREADLTKVNLRGAKQD